MEQRAIFALNQSLPEPHGADVALEHSSSTVTCLHGVGEHCYFKLSHLTGVGLLLLLPQLSQKHELPWPHFLPHFRHKFSSSGSALPHCFACPLLFSIPTALNSGLNFVPEGCQNHCVTCVFSLLSKPSV